MKSTLFLFLFTCSVSLLGQNSDTLPADIFKLLATADTLSGAKVSVSQDESITNSLLNRNSTIQSINSGTGSGFRIQVFSSNIQRTAKTEAFNIEKEIRTVFPDLGVYVSYTSPFWKVRVGDFRTTQEAQEFRAELIDAFPNLKNAIYTVKEKINY